MPAGVNHEPLEHPGDFFGELEWNSTPVLMALLFFFYSIFLLLNESATDLFRPRFKRVIGSFSASKTTWKETGGWTFTASAVFFFCSSRGRCSSSSSLFPLRQTPAGWGHWRWHHCVSLAHYQLALRVMPTTTAAAILYNNYSYDHIHRLVINRIATRWAAAPSVSLHYFSSNKVNTRPLFASVRLHPPPKYQTMYI